MKNKNSGLKLTRLEKFLPICHDILTIFSDPKRGENETFNITFGKAETLYKFVTILAKEIKNLKFKIEKRDSFRPKRGTLSIAKAKKLLNYKPNYDLQKGIKKYINFVNLFKKNKNY